MKFDQGQAFCSEWPMCCFFWWDLKQIALLKNNSFHLIVVLSFCLVVKEWDTALFHSFGVGWCDMRRKFQKVQGTGFNGMNLYVYTPLRDSKNRIWIIMEILIPPWLSYVPSRKLTYPTKPPTGSSEVIIDSKGPWRDGICDGSKEGFQKMFALITIVP